MALVEQVVISSGDGSFHVSFILDDVAHKWTIIQAINASAGPVTCSGDVNGTPFTFTIAAGQTASRAVSIQLVQTTSWKGQVVWVAPFEYSLAIQG